jgi:geranylgeranyl diphosphate synthase type II
MIHLLNQATTAERERLQNFLGQQRREKHADEVAWVRALMDRHGSIDYAREVAHGLAGAATREFETAFGGLPESRDLAFIRELPSWVLERA